MLFPLNYEVIGILAHKLNEKKKKFEGPSIDSFLLSQSIFESKIARASRSKLKEFYFAKIKKIKHFEKLQIEILLIENFILTFIILMKLSSFISVLHFISLIPLFFNSFFILFSCNQ